MRIEFTVSKETFERFNARKAELSIEAGKELSVEQVFEKLLSMPVRKQASKRIRVGSSSTRYIPKVVKQEVYARDNGQCSYESPDGVRCSERRFLQYDHIQPFVF